METCSVVAFMLHQVSTQTRKFPPLLSQWRKPFPSVGCSVSLKNTPLNVTQMFIGGNRSQAAELAAALF